MAKPVSMNPFKRIVNVHWNTVQPVYITVGLFAFSETGAVHAVVPTLSSAAIAAGATIEIQYAEEKKFRADLAREFYGLIIMKFPRPLTASQTAFSLAFSGTQHMTTFPGSDYTCGHFFLDYELAYVSPEIVAQEISPVITTFVTLDKWHLSYTQTDPNGTVTKEWDTWTIRPGDSTVPVPPAPGFPAGGGPWQFNYDRNSLYYYNDDGDLVDTGLACDTTPNQINSLPFAGVTIVANPVKDHSIQIPAWPSIDVEDAVLPTTHPGHYGDETELWRITFSQIIKDGTMDFTFCYEPFYKLSAKKIFKVYPTNTLSSGLTIDDGRGPTPDFRLPNFTFGTNFYFGAWDEDNGGPFDKFFAGTAPPLLTYDPTA